MIDALEEEYGLKESSVNLRALLFEIIFFLNTDNIELPKNEFLSKFKQKLSELNNNLIKRKDNPSPYANLRDLAKFWIHAIIIIDICYKERLKVLNYCDKDIFVAG